MPGGAQRRAALVLVGFMGAGKTVVGSELAARLAVPFTDSDALIEAEAGPIPEIFASSGEAGFRALEARVVVAAVEKLGAEPKVLALGGGAVLSREVQTALRAGPWVVWLTGSVEELWRRVQVAGADSRPLARDEAAFRALFAQREGLYREVAALTVDTTGRSPGEVADEIATRLRAGADAAAGCAGVAVDAAVDCCDAEEGAV